MPKSTPVSPEVTLATTLRRLQQASQAPPAGSSAAERADARAQSLRFNTYLHALNAQGWPSPRLGELAGISGAAVRDRVAQDRASDVPADIEGLPLPDYVDPTAEILKHQTISGLRIPDADAATKAGEQEAAREIKAAGLEAMNEAGRARGGRGQVQHRRDLALAQLRHLAGAIAKTDAELAAAEELRDTMVLAIVVHSRTQGVRRASHYNRTFSDLIEKRTGLRYTEVESLRTTDAGREQLARVAKARRIWKYRDPENQLFDATTDYLRLTAKKKTLVDRRNTVFVQAVDSESGSWHNGTTEAAEAAGISPGAARVMLSRARARAEGAERDSA